MPANTKPVFAITPRITQVFNTTANTAFDGSGTLVDLVTGATNGSKVTWVKVKDTQWRKCISTK
jgi:hypothetical protein